MLLVGFISALDVQSSCKFAHQKEELQELPDLACTKLCLLFALKICVCRVVQPIICSLSATHEFFWFLEPECLQGQRSNSQGKMLISTGHWQRSPVSSVHHVYVGSLGSVCAPSAGSCDDPECRYAHNRTELKEIPGLVQSQDFIELQ